VGIAEVARAWTRWLDVLEAQGFAAHAMTRPGASTEHLDHIIAVSGIALPDDMLALYRLSNGQRPSWPRNKLDSGFTTDLFPMYSYLSIEQAAKEWQRWKGIFDQEGPSGMADHAESVTAPEPDKVATAYWHPGWWPLARDGGGNLLAVDTAPLAAGHAGQIIVMGSDEDTRRVFAPGIVAYLDALSAAILEIGEHDGQMYWDVPALR
jgi:cell wall assembly regulator SMI1